MCVWLRVCVYERERACARVCERKSKERERERERERARVCVRVMGERKREGGRASVPGASPAPFRRAGT